MRDRQGRQVRVVVKVRPSDATCRVRVVVRRAGETVRRREARLEDGRRVLDLVLRPGRYAVVVTYLGDEQTQRSRTVERVTLR